MVAKVAFSASVNLRQHLLHDVDPKIPQIPTRISELLTGVMEESISLDELGALIEQYPVIAARLIALANSAWSAPAREICAIRPACSRLGIDVVRTVAIALTISSPFDASKCSNFDVRRFWCTTMILADAAEHLAADSDIDPIVARAAGLFRHLGLLWLTSAAPEPVSFALHQANSDPSVGLNDLLVEHCQIGYLEATSILLRAWKLPTIIVAAVDPHACPVGVMLQRASDTATELYSNHLGCRQAENPSSICASSTCWEDTEILAERAQRTVEMAELLFP